MSRYFVLWLLLLRREKRSMCHLFVVICFFVFVCTNHLHRYLLPYWSLLYFLIINFDKAFFPVLLRFKHSYFNGKLYYLLLGGRGGGANCGQFVLNCEFKIFVSFSCILFYLIYLYVPLYLCTRFLFEIKQ